MRTVFTVFLGLMAVSNASMRGPFRQPVSLPNIVFSEENSNSSKAGIDSHLMNPGLRDGLDPNQFKRHVFILSEMCPIPAREMIFGDEIIVESQHPAEESYKTGVACSTNFTRLGKDGGIIVTLVNAETVDCRDYMKVNSITDRPVIFCGNKNETGTSVIYENDNLEVTWHTEVNDKQESKKGAGVRILLTSFQNECRVSQPCFKCDNGLIIDQFHMCNGWNNCGDWSDEKYCPPLHMRTCRKSGHGWLITMSVLFVAAALIAGMLAVKTYRLTRQQNGEPVGSGAESRSFLPEFLRRMF